MENFDKALNKLFEHEGFYSHDTVDIGGQTIFGISRRANPHWSGWEIVDKAIAEHNLSSLKNDENIIKLAGEFYKQNYWDIFHLDNYTEDIGYEIFEYAVNVGSGTLSLHLQEVINTMNKNETLYNDIEEDGKFGRLSHSALKTCIEKNGEKRFLVFINVRQTVHYWTCMRRRSTNEKYIGWFNRSKYGSV